MIQNIKVSPSILDAFQNVLTGKYNETTDRLIDKINKVAEYQQTEAMHKGSAFHRLTENDPSIWKLVVDKKTAEVCYQFQFWQYGQDLTNSVYFKRKDFFHECYVENFIHTSFGPVKLYGYVDDIGKGIVQDLKTTKQYQGGLSYYDAMQWRVYLYCTKSHTFRYLITDFTNLYPEQYEPYPDLENDLRAIIEKYCAFLHENVNKINLEFVTY